MASDTPPQLTLPSNIICQGEQHTHKAEGKMACREITSKAKANFHGSLSGQTSIQKYVLLIR